MKFLVTGMTCESCVHHVQSAIQKVAGVKEAKVSLQGNEADVTADSNVKPDEIVQAVKNAGYGAQAK